MQNNLRNQWLENVIELITIKSFLLLHYIVDFDVIVTLNFTQENGKYSCGQLMCDAL
jgi:hypothetical protein